MSRPNGAFPVKTRWVIIARDSDDTGTPTCQWCGRAVDVFSGHYSIQHRRARGMGGTRQPDTSEAQNGALVHGSGTTGCHGYIEAHPEEAKSRGFRISQWQNPAQVPLTDWLGRSWLLRRDGGRELVTT